jgi:hypothetical protein
LYLNTRGHKTPWEFAAIELEFSPMLAMNACEDRDFCSSVMIDFTEAVDPSTYGKLKRFPDDSTENCDNHNKYELCARRSFQVLLIQQRILAFLLACTKAILHDTPDDDLLTSPLQEAPPIAQILVDKHAEHTSFTNVLNIAPYRGWDSMNFSQLRGYIESTCTTQKDHIWALREDPGYFRDTVQEYLDHSLCAIALCCSNQPNPYIRWSGYKAYIIDKMLHESYESLNGWSELNKWLGEFNELMQEGATMQRQSRAILEFERVAWDIGSRLLTELFECSRAAPEARKLLRQKCGTSFREYKYEFVGVTTAAERRVLDVLDFARPKEKTSLLDWPRLLALHLEMVDHLLQTSATARRMITGRLLSLLTDLSIITECLRQTSLWSKSPDVETGKVSACTCKLTMEHTAYVAFNSWVKKALADYSPPWDMVFPLQGKFHYPEHKKSARDTVTAMCKAEQNLDLFWAAMDSQFEKSTGTAQHQLIRDCLEGSGIMHRTAPWESRPVIKVKTATTLNLEYQPIPNQLHSSLTQITGDFDRTTIRDKSKPKTRGIAKPDLNSIALTAVELHKSTNADIARTYTVDKRTYNIFRTFFGAPSEGVEEVPKSAKWADFRRAMVRMGFGVEKLQGSAWQFTPSADVGSLRGIQFHEPHPDSDITYVIAKRIGRRLGRVYGWHGDMFKLA